MRRFGLTGLAVSLAIFGAGSSAALAQSADTGDVDPMMQAWIEAMTPGPQHEAMAELVGSWSVTTTHWMQPGGEPQVSQGTAERSMIFDGRILEEQFHGEMDGMPFQGRATTGYDNITGRYWGTWIDSMSTGVTLLYGGIDEASGLWVMEGETPNPMTGGMMPMRIESRMDGDDRHVDEFYMPGPDGEMFRTMEMVYERQ